LLDDSGDDEVERMTDPQEEEKIIQSNQGGDMTVGITENKGMSTRK
jgi:hypothetical protein